MHETRKSTELQDLIFSELERQGRTKRSLCKEIGCDERLAGRWKAHEVGMSIDYADKALKVLGISFTLGESKKGKA